jgi:prepilin-type N-terminal cleavage/methylation domain-containing protein
MISASVMVLAPANAGPVALRQQRACGFTLLELLVVIAIVATLAALILATLPRAKEAARVTQCLSNLGEIGCAIQSYIQDNEGRYPPESGLTWMSFRLGGGDPDPAAAARIGLESAGDRILWSYTTSREVYHCPSDRGMDNSPVIAFDSLYAEMGSSYKYNTHPWCGDPRIPEKDPKSGVAGKSEGWISLPSSYILLHEPPASPYYDVLWRYYFWHYARGKATVHEPYSLNAIDRSISPVLFADQHAAKHDFTRAIRSSPDYPFEPQPLWYWYEAAPRGQ